jgi:hypothetical protein
MRRADGTVNPNKVKKVFMHHRLTIEPWAFECPIMVPDEFANARNPASDKLAINWDEVATEFAR